LELDDQRNVLAMLQHIGPISGVAAHEDAYIATAGDDGQVILWEKATGKSVSSSLHDDVVNDCAFSRDGRYLVTSSSDCTARLWSVPDLSLKAMLAEHGDDVTTSAFHPVDELIATASRDCFVRVYDFDGRLVAEFGGVVGDVVWLDWTHDGRELVALSDDGKMTHWRWATIQPVDAIGPGSAEYSSGHSGAAHCRGHGNWLGRRKRHNISAGERKPLHEWRRQRPHEGRQREHSDGRSSAGPAGRGADPSEYVLASVRCALPQPNRTLWLEKLTVHVQGRRPPRQGGFGD
jgi:WD40 repeat protein